MVMFLSFVGLAVWLCLPKPEPIVRSGSWCVNGRRFLDLEDARAYADFVENTGRRVNLYVVED